MKKLSFEDVYTLGDLVKENGDFRHYHYPEMLIRYDSNFIDFKTLPSITKFIKVEKYLREYHLNKGQKHVKFYFPENIKPTEEFKTYLSSQSYKIGFLELYAIQPNNFPSVRNNPDIAIQVVTEGNLDRYLDLQYKHDLEIGNEYAKQKAKLIMCQFKNQNIQQILAFYKGIPAGYVDVIISNETAEIDSLTVDESFRNKGIGSQLQKFVMNSFPNKVVLLVADGEDTPREMYKKKNYEFFGFKYQIQKADEE